jgi:type VI secretion system protein ImpK
MMAAQDGHIEVVRALLAANSDPRIVFLNFHTALSLAKAFNHHAIAALLDEIAMTLPDLRPLWSQAPLQSTRWMTNNAGVELFERLERVRSGPKPVLATFVVVLGVGFVGRYALPGADRDELLQLRRRLAIELGVDADRDWPTGVLKRAKLYDGGDASQAERWFEKLVTGRVLAASLLVASVSAVLFAIFGGGR